MKKTTSARIFWAGAAVCIVSSGLYLAGLIPLVVCAVLIVPLFPVTVMSLFFWWMAREPGGDFPFIGY